VIPFFNEGECIDRVCNEIQQVLSGKDTAVPSWECILVDDGSSDRTGVIIAAWARRNMAFRPVHMRRRSGQSAALHAGFRAARGAYIATMDGDGQNDPGDLPDLLRELEARQIDMICGIRQRRADNLVRKASSRIANHVRRFVLRDGIIDTGCALRVFRRECLAEMPLFRNAHRFLPALAEASGYRVAQKTVRHRSRLDGRSKYGTGINSRLWVGLADLAGVFWLCRRALPRQGAGTMEVKKHA
jgi:dolichol-phosphate mannosyltransferase